MAKGTASRAVRTVVVVVLVAIIAFIVALEVSAFQVHGQLTRAMDSMEQLQAHLNTGDWEAASRNAREVAQAAQDARREVSGPQWQLARQVPVLGDDVAVAIALAEVADDVSGGAAVPLLDLVERVSGGDLSALAQLPGELSAARTAVDAGQAKLQALPATHLAQLADGERQLEEALEGIEPALSAADDLVAGVQDLAALLGAGADAGQAA